MERVDIKVPQLDGEALLAPPAGELVELVGTNARRVGAYDFALGGRSFASLRTAAREEILRAARNYTAGLGVKVSDAPHDLIIQTGHQPEFVHPGIWIKNHLADRLSHAVGGVSLNVVVDNDAPPAGGFTVPVRRPGGFHRQHVAFAEVDATRAWEEHDDPSAWRFDAFVDELGRLVYPGIESPMLSRYFEDLGEWSSKGENLAHVLTALRRRYEEGVGVSNLELPVSKMCDTCAFARFVLALASDAERFVRDYNASLAEYRRLNGIHSPSHPMPDLPAEGRRCELPFWVWQPRGPRKRLCVGTSDGLNLVLEDEPVFHVDAATARRLSAGDAEAFDVQAARLRDESRGRYRIRPRALTLTIFSRLFISEVFIHGVGGAKYDEIADEIVRRHFDVEPPAKIACSATLFLPIDVEDARREDLRRLRREIRDIRYNPQRHFNGDPPKEADRLISQRRELVALSAELRERAPEGEGRSLRDRRRKVFLEIRHHNERLASFLDDRLRRLQEELERTRGRVDDQAAVRDRTYPFILYPRRQVLDFYEEVLQV